MLVTYYDCYNVLTKVYGGGAYIKQALLDTKVEERNRSAITKICYGVLDKDIELTYALNSLSQKNPKLPIRILSKIGFYAVKYLKTPPHAVTDNLVELCKKLGKGGASGFLNAVLRKYAKTPPELPLGNGAHALSIKYSCPEFIVKKLLKTYGANKTESILAFYEEYTYVRFSANINGEEYLKNGGYTYEKTPFDNLFQVKKFTLNADFYDGVYTFQSIGSVAICDVLPTGNALLDCCSAPGGKATLLASKYSSVTACDVHLHRVELIKSYVERMKVSNVKAILQDATILNEEFVDAFDSVLCDAPCSGTGVIKQNPDIKLNRTEKAITELSQLQLSILQNVKNYVKLGGRIVYSTCSILEEENDNVIDKFLSLNSDFESVEISSKLVNLKTKHGLQFTPDVSLGAGFYVCLLKRIK